MSVTLRFLRKPGYNKHLFTRHEQRPYHHEFQAAQSTGGQRQRHKGGGRDEFLLGRYHGVWDLFSDRAWLNR